MQIIRVLAPLRYASVGFCRPITCSATLRKRSKTEQEDTSADLRLTYRTLTFGRRYFHSGKTK